MLVGGAQQLAAAGTYSDGTSRDLTAEAVWTSSNPAAVTIAGSGLATCVAPGTSTVSASVASISGTATLTVTAVVPSVTLSSITVSPSNPSAAAGNTTQLTATGKYSDGTSADVTSTATWTSSSASVATYDGGGLFMAVAPGTSTLTASLAGVAGSTTFTVTAAVIASISVVAPAPSLGLGLAQQLTASAVYSDGSSTDVTAQASWTSSSPSVATISTGGLVTSVAAGTTSVTASFGGISGSDVLAVVALSSIAVTPANPTAPAGVTTPLLATGKYSDSSTHDITSIVLWASSNTSAATVSPSGVVTAVATGASTLTASQAGISGTVTFTVTAATLSSIAVTPPTPSIQLALTQQLTATGAYSDGTHVDLSAQVTWASATPTVATVTSTGLATGLLPGTTVVTATLGAISGQTTLTTTATLSTITVTPASPSVAAGLTTQLVATGKYADASSHDITNQVAWGSSNTSAVTIASLGLAKAVAIGSATTTASIAGVSGSTVFTVTAATLSSLSITPGNSSAAPGSTPQLTAIGTYTDATTKTLTSQVTWSSSSPTVATVSPTGLVAALVIGHTTIKGTLGAIVGSTNLWITKVKPSSYLNKNDVGAAPVSVPIQPWQWSFGLADFFQDGTLSLVLHTLLYNSSDPSTFADFGEIYFFKMVNGVWVDNTSLLLTNTVGCLHPRKVVIADFNNDTRPDVYFACTGPDIATPPGEQNHILLSQPGGTYSNVTLPLTCYCHGASAADLNGDGFADLVVTDTAVAFTPYVLLNNGDGSFTADYTRFPASFSRKGIYALELVDFGNRGLYDVFVGGNEPGATAYPIIEVPDEILPNDGSGSFASTTPVILGSSPWFGGALDILFLNNYVYILRVGGNTNANEIAKVAYPAGSQSVIYSISNVQWPNHLTWIDLLLLYNGQIVTEDASYGLSFPP